MMSIFLRHGHSVWALMVTLNNNRVYGNSRLYAFSILPPEYSSPAVNVEPVQAFFGAILVRLAAYLKCWSNPNTVSLVTYLLLPYRGYSFILSTSIPWLFEKNRVYCGTDVWPVHQLPGRIQRHIFEIL